MDQPLVSMDILNKKKDYNGFFFVVFKKSDDVHFDFDVDMCTSMGRVELMFILLIFYVEGAIKILIIINICY